MGHELVGLQQHWICGEGAGEPYAPYALYARLFGLYAALLFLYAATLLGQNNSAYRGPVAAYSRAVVAYGPNNRAYSAYGAYGLFAPPPRPSVIPRAHAP